MRQFWSCGTARSLFHAAAIADDRKVPLPPAVYRKPRTQAAAHQTPKQFTPTILSGGRQITLPASAMTGAPSHARVRAELAAGAAQVGHVVAAWRSQLDNSEPDASRTNPRALLAREWVYLLMVILALFGFRVHGLPPKHRRRSTGSLWLPYRRYLHHHALTDSQGRDFQRLRLLWTQALHSAAVFLSMNPMFEIDVRPMMNGDASALAALSVLALGTFTAGVHIAAWRTRLVGIILGAEVPANVWLQQSALFHHHRDHCAGGGGYIGLLAWQRESKHRPIANRRKVRTELTEALPGFHEKDVGRGAEQLPPRTIAGASCRWENVVAEDPSNQEGGET